MPAEKTLAAGCDHAGLALKTALLDAARARGWEILDLGTQEKDSVDYPDFAHAVCRAIPGQAAMGLLVCGSGIGMSIAANRHPHIRAALCHNVTTARLAREHNDANILVLGERLLGAGLAAECLEIFLATPYARGRHQRRLDKINP